jgi:hypothetical protein
MLEKGKRSDARRLLTRVYREGPPAKRQTARKVLRRINRELVFNPRCIEGTTIHVVKPGQTLSTIAGKYDVNWRMLQLLNGISGHLIRVNQKLKVLTGKREILVDKSNFRLALFVGDAFIKEYQVGIGKGDRTPTGTFEVDKMLIKPDWYPPEGGVIEYGEEGHLIGERWIGLANQPGASGIGIHGTNEPDSVGTRCSNGCIRMRNKDVKELYAFTTPGTRVRIVE